MLKISHSRFVHLFLSRALPVLATVSLLCGGTPAQAATLQILPAARTLDSRFTVQGPVLAGSKWLWLKITQGENRYDHFENIAGKGSITASDVLRFGPGDYKVKVLVANSGATPSGLRYTALAEFPIHNDDARDLRFLAPSLRVESEDLRIISLAREITAGANNDRDKALALHDWVAQNIDFDVVAFVNNRMSFSSALETLESRKVVCNGYANLLAALARASGLPTRIALGQVILPTEGQTWASLRDATTVNHAWNQIQVDGRWITVDATWDAGTVDLSRQAFTRKVNHKYFDPAEGEFATDHRLINTNGG